MNRMTVKQLRYSMCSLSSYLKFTTILFIFHFDGELFVLLPFTPSHYEYGSWSQRLMGYQNPLILTCIFLSQLLLPGMSALKMAASPPIISIIDLNKDALSVHYIFMCLIIYSVCSFISFYGTVCLCCKTNYLESTKILFFARKRK